MKFTLKDYQTDAVRDVLSNLTKARKYWHNEADRSSFSLTAVTGAGKTVMAAAVFEALFHGNDDFEFDAADDAALFPDGEHLGVGCAVLPFERDHRGRTCPFPKMVHL